MTIAHKKTSFVQTNEVFLFYQHDFTTVFSIFEFEIFLSKKHF